MVKKTTLWYDKATWAALLGILSLTGCVLVAFHSLDTGSWQQYGIAFVLLVFGGNRLAHAIKTAVRGRAHA